MCVCVCQGYIGQMSEPHLPAEIPGKMSKSAAVQSLGSIVRLDIKTSHKFPYFPRNFPPFLEVNRSTLPRPGIIHLCESGLELRPGEVRWLHPGGGGFPFFTSVEGLLLGRPPPAAGFRPKQPVMSDGWGRRLPIPPTPSLLRTSLQSSRLLWLFPKVKA